MSNLTFNNQPLPAWLQTELYKLSPNPNANDIIWLLLQDYIAKNKPPWEDLTPRGYVERYAVKNFNLDGSMTWKNHDFDREETHAYGSIYVLAYKEMQEGIRDHNRKGIADIKAKVVF